MTTLHELPGDATALTSYGTKYERIAESIAEVSRKLVALSSETSSRGESIEQFSERARDLSADISKAQRRYHETALAIVEFAVALEAAQQQANQARSAADNSSHQVANLEYERRILEEDRLTALSVNAGADVVDDLTDRIRRLDHRIDALESAVSGAVSTYNAAERDRQEAVATAIARISPVLGELNDTIGDHIHAAVDGLGDFFAAIGTWITDVLQPILETIVAVVLAVVAILLIAAIVISILLSFGIVGLVLAVVVAAVAILLAGYIIYTVTQSAIQPTPTMKPITLPPPAAKTTSGGHRQTDDLRENGYLDSMGGEESTIIEVIKVVGDDGVVRWRVILPSTQDWELVNGLLDTPPVFDPKGDQGALNDLGSNVMLMLTPVQEAAYQRAVRQAMLDAGVGPHDPVMMVGWSQGGILAGRFAENTHDEFNVQAIFVAGSPIDAMSIPTTVDVISIQHPDDIVHKLDLTGAHPNSSSWYTVSNPPYNGGANHSSGSYAATADAAFNNRDSDPDLARLYDKQQVFYWGTETVNAYQGAE